MIHGKVIFAVVYGCIFTLLWRLI